MPTVYLGGHGASWAQNCRQGQAGGGMAALRWGMRAGWCAVGTGEEGVLGELAEDPGLRGTRNPGHK